MTASPIVDADPADATAIAALIREGYGASPTLAATIYGCAGYSAYVRELISLGARSGYRYRVVRTNTIVAFTETRSVGASTFLNNIAVSSVERNHGRGRDLLADLFAFARSAGSASIDLDVFADNAVARTWYRRAGFETTEIRSYWTRRLDRAAASGKATFPDYAAAQAVHARYGFSELTVRRDDRSQRIGRIGERYFRLPDAATARDAELRGELATLDASRSLLVISDDDSLGDSGYELLARSERMRFMW